MPGAKPCAVGQQSTQLTVGTRCVFWQVSWFEVGSGKAALPGPTHQPVTLTVRWLDLILNCYLYYDLCIEIAKRILTRINIALIGKDYYL